MKSGFQIQWENINGTVTFVVSANVLSWIGIGLKIGPDHKFHQSAGIDYVIATFDKNGCQVNDMYLQGGDLLPINDTDILNGRNDIISSSCFQTAGYSTFIFSRKLETVDLVADNDLVFGAEGSNDLIWVYGKNNTYPTVGFDCVQGLVPNFAAPKVMTSPGPNYFSYHVGFMFAAFAGLLPLGIFVARYLRDSQKWWFPVHIFLQLTGMIFTFIGIAMAVKMVGGVSLDNNHAILGTTTLCLFYISIVLGATSHFNWNPKRKSTPIFPDIIHWLGGHLTLIFGFVTIILGMLQVKVGQGIIVVFGLTFATIVVACLIIELYKWKFQSKPKENIELKRSEYE
ncbi:cytochrome b561 / ferric reductase transmembrane domain-containing protein [Heterostelium album PN500]|uniref:Cytochrome b561 / ferric reductase transmembrane domain-containing protein n=1 Tax=Heterostelium pallidum (strain ATCC 26659 / Pp 5 / PN500) TaxID=670386 RepID=D3BFG2_HETP5|nr:cytochrome b561 / ferric reductase transmembrane domain-containing protein [Heterostelium album PN500]EFA79876.1 cytochrome b561 / ferric reductase transmembrane domain-containing protein [Heterostelium album PN500]|eukprot:XP_020431997.1 cytochrome b561 / ferric reductase transmembrane domain-containing protein [Heterostelium album PN500]